MNIAFTKYHALGNDFIVIEQSKTSLTRRSLPGLARTMCSRRTGVGADGILFLSASRKADCRMDVYNADGSWAEKSGNGLRITGLHLALNGGEKKTKRTAKEFRIETGTTVDSVTLIKKTASGYLMKAELGRPTFEAASVPVKTRQKYVINSPMKIGREKLPMTCLAVGNPHTIILVGDFDFDWQALGADLETASLFPNGTNVEFVKVINRKKFRVAEWERGAGATGSSGTGAGAVVAAMVTLGLAERTCEVEFDMGSLTVHWRADDDILELTGPVAKVMQGTVEK